MGTGIGFTELLGLFDSLINWVNGILKVIRSGIETSATRMLEMLQYFFCSTVNQLFDIMLGILNVILPYVPDWAVEYSEVVANVYYAANYILPLSEFIVVVTAYYSLMAVMVAVNAILRVILMG